MLAPPGSKLHVSREFAHLAGGQVWEFLLAPSTVLREEDSEGGGRPGVK